MAHMGQFSVSVRLTGPTGRSEEVGLLVDTGAFHLVLPRELAERLELVATRWRRVRTAGGETATWPLAEVRLTVGDDELPTLCLIAASGPGLLGSVALEGLLLGVDPLNKRLVPIESPYL